MINVQEASVEKSERKIPLRRHCCTRYENIETDLGEISCESEDSSRQIQDAVHGSMM
jgi:hypothetical protein